MLRRTVQHYSMVAPVELYHLLFSRARLFFGPTFLFACRIFHGVAWVFLALYFSGKPVYAESASVVKAPDITIVQSDGDGPYAQFADALRIILGRNGIVPAVIDSSQTIPNSRLVISVGMKAATVVAAGNAPAVLDVYVLKSDYEKLLREFPSRKNTHTFSAIFLDQPIYRQAYLVSAIFPGKHNVGVLYSNPPDELPGLRDELRKQGEALQEQAVDQALPLGEALQNVLQRSEVLLMLPDAGVYNSSTIRNILMATYRSNVPLIGISSGYVKAGALCAVISTPEQIAEQAAELVLQFGNTGALPPPQYPHEFEVGVNDHVARSLDLRVKSAVELHDEIVRMGRKKQ